MYSPSDKIVTQVQRGFVYHPPAGSQTARYVVLREAAQQLAKLIIYNTPESREQSLALTKLDEVVMHANSAIARNEVWDGNTMLAPLQLEYVPPA